MKPRGEIKWWAVLIWLLIWQAAAMLVNSELLLVSPVRTVTRLWELAGEGPFWGAVGYSFLRIALGFLIGTLLGVLLAILAGRFPPVRQLLAPLMLTVRSVPVASFIVVILIWFGARQLSVVIDLLMVLPIIYTNTLTGILSRDGQIGEVARVFRVSPVRRGLYMDLPQVLPHFRSGCRLALGLCWKAGIAAELISQPKGSIGAELQMSRLYLETRDVFAWTLAIILLSMAAERVVLAGLKLLERRVTRVPERRGGKRLDEAHTAAPGPYHGVFLRGLRKSFDGKEVLPGVDLRIPEGATTCVMAPSGAGKTTLVRVLLGLIPPDGGTIIGLQARRIAAVFQEDRLVEPMDAVSNIRLVSPGVDRQTVLDALASFGLSADSAAQPVRELSGGMRRRVALLRALLADWDLLTLDEPFQGLDEATRREVIREVRSRSGGRTVLLITHDPEEAALMGARVTALPGAEDAPR